MGIVKICARVLLKKMHCIKLSLPWQDWGGGGVEKCNKHSDEGQGKLKLKLRLDRTMVEYSVTKLRTCQIDMMFTS